MPTTKRELAPIALPATLITTTALTCGVLVALALQIYLNRAGFDLVGLWGNLFSTKAMQRRLPLLIKLIMALFVLWPLIISVITLKRSMKFIVF